MSEPTLKSVQCLDARGLHRMAYWQWGDPANRRVLLCVHGLTRQGRDFDELARALAGPYRVVCPDVVGRGRSDRLADPMGYTVPTYVADMVTLLARLDADVVDWVGTSMGGLIGLGVAALDGSPLRRLVLNELWAVSQGFGPHTREQWLRLTEAQLMADGQGGLVPRCDPAIALPLRAVTPEIARTGEAQLWQAWDRLRCPTLVLRGVQSDILAPETARQMATRGPRAQLHEFSGVGHAPTLVPAAQIQVVRRFLLAP